jgi:Holliday junction resolvase
MTNLQKEILITKTSGIREPFSDFKLKRSLEKVGAPSDIADTIIGTVRAELKEGITTTDIYRRAFDLLSVQNRAMSGRYALRRGVMELGPTGHPFEKLVGEILKTDGFSVEVGKIVQGSCVSHEVDVVAQKDDLHIMVECKFHNQLGVKSDVKVALYVQARFEDVQKAWKSSPDHAKKFHEAWLVTNTKLTSDAIRYAECVGMKAIGWSYPLDNSLEMRIERSGLHPVTCLVTLNHAVQQQLLAKNVILCKEVMEHQDVLQSVGLSKSEIDEVLSEIHQLCRIH